MKVILYYVNGELSRGSLDKEKQAKNNQSKAKFWPEYKMRNQAEF